jgi:hypothetical protein
MPELTKEQLQERAQLCRILDSLCHIEHPTAEEYAGRLAVIKKIGVCYGLKEMRSVSIQGSTPTPRARA